MSDVKPVANSSTAQEAVEAVEARLLHLSSVSLTPLDIRYIEWNVTQALSGKVVTMIQTKYKLFVLDSACVNYKADIELLKEAIK